MNSSSSQAMPSFSLVPQVRTGKAAVEMRSLLFEGRGEEAVCKLGRGLPMIGTGRKVLLSLLSAGFALTIPRP